MTTSDPALSAVLLQLAEAREAIATLQMQVGSLLDEEGEPSKGYLPKPSVRWWRDLGPESEAAEVAKIRAWYQQIAMPWLGSPELPGCAYEHGLVRTTLDTAAELWGALWLPERRTVGRVSGQAEFLARMWPALLETLIRDTTSCEHRRQAGRLEVAG